MDLLPQLRAAVARHQLLSPGERLLVAVSGGADSTALAELLWRLSQDDFPLTLALAYLDHGLRAQAKDEAAYVAQLAASRGLRFFWDKIDLRSDKDTGLEQRGRHLRYQFLARCARDFGASKVAVAHHADDQAETVLLHMLRGCGIHGLAAIAPLRELEAHSDIRLIRPLIDMRKADLIRYLQERNISWFEDHSNDDIHFTRNRIRHRVLPALQSEGFADVVSALNRTARHCREITAYLQQQAASGYAKARRPWCEARPDFARLLGLAAGHDIACAVANDALDSVPSVLLPFWLRLMLADIGGEEATVEEGHYAMLEKLRQDHKGLIRLSGQTVIWRTPDITCAAHETGPDWQVPGMLPLPGALPLTPCLTLTATNEEVTGNGEEWLRRRAPSLLVAHLACATVKPPFTVRRWQPGDIIWPLGAMGRRKVASVLSDAKVPLPLRAHVLVVSDSRGDIVWLPGIAISHTCRLIADTPRAIVLAMTNQCRTSATAVSS